MDRDRIVTTEQLRRSLGIDEAVLEDIRALRPFLEQRVGEMIEALYAWLPRFPEFDVLFTEDSVLERVKQQQTMYWTEFFCAQIDHAYVYRRRTVGQVHAQIGLGPMAYLRAMGFVADWFATALESREVETGASEQTTQVVSLRKLVQFDAAIALEAYAAAIQIAGDSDLEHVKTDEKEEEAQPTARPRGGVHHSVMGRIGLILGLALLLLWGNYAAITTVVSEGEDDALVINLAGRQRMLSQKMTKEAFVLTRVASSSKPDVDLAGYEEQLRQTMNDFDTTLDALIRGGQAPLDSHGAETRAVPAPTTTPIMGQLAQVQIRWSRLQDDLRQVLASRGHDQAAVSSVIENRPTTAM